MYEMGYFVTCMIDYCMFLLNIFQLKVVLRKKMCIFAKSKVHRVLKGYFSLACVYFARMTFY